MNQRKVLQLLHGLNTGGAEVLADRLGRRLAERYQVRFACLDQVGELGERLQEDAFCVDRLGRSQGLDWRCVRQLAALLRRERIDLIHAHQYTPFFYAMATRLVGVRCPILFTEHGRFVPDYPRRKRVFFNRTMLRQRDRLVAVGKDVRRALVENEGLPADRIEVIYNGIDIERFERRRGEAGSALRKQLGISEAATLVVQVARLSPLKDHGTAVRAIAESRGADAEIHLVVVGTGPEESRLRQAIAECEVADRVHCVGLRHDIPAILSEADVLLLTSISEGIPLTVIEGMAAGLPIVSTAVGGLTEIIEDPTHGFLQPAGDHAGLARRLCQLARDPRLRKQMGQAGHRRARELFSEATMHHQYEVMMERMLEDVTSRRIPA